MQVVVHKREPKSFYRHFDISWARTPRSHFFISTALYIVFLGIQAITATQVANVQPNFGEGGAMAVVYLFAWGHFFDEWAQCLQFKKAGNWSAYWGDTGNWIDMIRVHLFAISFFYRLLAMVINVEVTSGIFRTATISYSFFIVLCWVHFLSRTVGMNRNLG